MVDKSGPDTHLRGPGGLGEQRTPWPGFPERQLGGWGRGGYFAIFLAKCEKGEGVRGMGAEVPGWGTVACGAGPGPGLGGAVGFRVESGPSLRPAPAWLDAAALWLLPTPCLDESQPRRIPHMQRACPSPSLRSGATQVPGTLRLEREPAPPASRPPGASWAEAKGRPGSGSPLSQGQRPEGLGGGQSTHRNATPTPMQHCTTTPMLLRMPC